MRTIRYSIYIRKLPDEVSLNYEHMVKHQPLRGRAEGALADYWQKLTGTQQKLESFTIASVNDKTFAVSACFQPLTKEQEFQYAKDTATQFAQNNRP